MRRGSGQAAGELSLQQRGYFAFHEAATYHALDGWLQEGWTVQTTNLTRSYGWAELTERMGKVDAAWTVICFAPTAVVERAA